jgi:aspartate beta-hydroxylase
MTDAFSPLIPELISAASRALQRGDPAGALDLLRQAETARPGDIDVALARAVALRVGGDLAGAIAALDQVLAADPYHFFALLSKGAIVERLVGTKAAARIYKHALKIAPDADRMPPPLRAQVEHAGRILAADRLALEEFVRARLSLLDDAQNAPSRFQETVDIYLGKVKPHVQAPLMLHYPQLPAIPFLPREMFPWFSELEAHTDIIRRELDALIAARAADFKPYIQFSPGDPVNQWQELNHSDRWSTLHLWRDGEQQTDTCARCPETTALLTRLPLAHQRGFGPTAMFSRLDANTTIPAHTGSSNVRLIAHLPLILPGSARFRVGNETRHWEYGKAWVFDDTIEHEAWNDADQARVILIFDVWNPFLSETERALVSALMLAGNDYYDVR